MGGFHSGRKRQHTCIDDCLEIDTTWLKKRKLLQGLQLFEMVWTRGTETNFKKKVKQEYKAAACLVISDEKSVLTLSYSVTSRLGDHGKEEQRQHVKTLSLESTSPNYGGQRWWFRSPCCGRRVRVLYINLKANIASMTPMCRDCQALHYPSQCASYQERHATYERHLLRNFGYWWAQDEYRLMPEHYFQVTPEYRYKAQRSELLVHLDLAKLVISTERFIIKWRIDTLKKFSVEGRQEFFERLANDPNKAEELAEYQYLANALIVSGVIPPDDDQADQSQGDDLPVDGVAGLQLVKWLARKEAIEQELKELEALAA